MEFVRVIRFAEFKKKVRSLARASFAFKSSQLEGLENSIFRTLLEVNKPLGLFAFGNYLF